ncbi:MAG: hypothetical protein Q7J28_17175 [Caulobacter sp.]|nr:hypothetical protein [Caulobacter sp.]
MPDPYSPALSTFSYTASQMAAITAAMLRSRPWTVKDPDVKAAKNAIRDLHLKRQEDTCCYCRMSLHGGGYFMIDREHVLPKAKYRPFVFEIWNLSVSCKRCNMELKRERDAFVVDKSATAPFQDSGNYRIIHPNFDEWEAHLARETIQLNRSVMTKIVVINDSTKGRYTFDFFKLQDLTKDSFDQVQNPSLISSENLTEGALEARELARASGQ